MVKPLCVPSPEESQSVNDNVFAGMMVADFLCTERDSLQQKLKLLTEERNVP